MPRVGASSGRADWRRSQPLEDKIGTSTYSAAIKAATTRGLAISGRRPPETAIREVAPRRMAVRCEAITGGGRRSVLSPTY